MNLKKLDDVDVVFVDKTFTKEESAAFSEFIRKKKAARKKTAATKSLKRK